jgi:hypothetical protein
VRTYTITELAGNSTRLVIKVLQPQHHGDHLTARLISIQYGSAAAVRFGRNMEQFAWDPAKDGSLDRLDQQLRIGIGRERQVADAEYEATQGLTRIFVKSPQPQPAIQKPGLLLLDMVTGKGQLSIRTEASLDVELTAAPIRQAMAPRARCCRRPPAAAPLKWPVNTRLLGQHEPTELIAENGQTTLHMERPPDDLPDQNLRSAAVRADRSLCTSSSENDTNAVHRLAKSPQVVRYYGLARHKGRPPGPRCCAATQAARGDRQGPMCRRARRGRVQSARRQPLATPGGASSAQSHPLRSSRVWSLRTWPFELK